MERFKLNIPTFVSQEVHHHLEIRLRADISCHDAVIGPVEEDLPEEF
jgi:hypothetical protein